MKNLILKTEEGDLFRFTDSEERTELLVGSRRTADIVMMRDTAVLDIDSDSDFEMMQLLAAYFYKTDPAFAEVKTHIPEILR